MKEGHTPVPVSKQRGRRVSLGTIPDFTFSGKGYRLSGVVPDSPAHRRGLKEGDVIIQVGTKAIENLNDMSQALKSVNPGEEISMILLRNGEKKAINVNVVER